jgi:murein tripeptide amidase MpaA
MINPDGVIFGNYRTSLSGKDLNRQFRTKKEELIPEVAELKKYIKKLKYECKYKIHYFLDFHGHSLKKNVFFYGP